MKHFQTISVLALAASLSGCASLGINLDYFKSSAVTYPDEMEQTVSFPKSDDVQDVKLTPAIYEPEAISPHPIDIELFDGPNMSGFQAVSYAHKEATIKPETHNYLNAIQLYPFAEGSIYQVYTSPQQVTDIALEKGEGLITVSAGDTKRWTVGDTVSGSGADQQVHIIVKPSEANLSTNAVITSTKRTYYLDLKSFADTYMAAVSWRYPRDVIKSIFKEKSEAPELVKASFQTTNLEVDSKDLRFDYLIKGDNPDWRPTRVFDDGKKVFIQFPKALAVSEAPPLFLTDANGKQGKLVNYRVNGDYYVVDRLFVAAELRLGEKKQMVVRIERLS